MIENYDHLMKSPPEKLKTLNQDDSNLIDICLKLFNTTIVINESYDDELEESSFDCGDYKLNCYEFSQNSIKRCIKFCMNLPGNSELCSETRAKLLKYGVYEIVILVMAYHYDPENDCLKLNNNVEIKECDMCQEAGFGMNGEKFFQFCRNFSKFNLDKTQFSILCALKFFTNDRPELIEVI